MIETHLTPRLKELTERLRGDYFRIRVSYSRSRSDDQIKEEGTPVSGIKAYDNDIHNQMFTTEHSVTMMLDQYKRGCRITVINEKDAQLIYELINNYIFEWKNTMQVRINNPNAPIEDLIVLDNFANDIYDHCANEFEDKHEELIQFGGNTFRPNPSLIAVKQPNQPIAEDPHRVKKRISFAEFFENRSVFNRRN